MDAGTIIGLAIAGLGLVGFLIPIKLLGDSEPQLEGGQQKELESLEERRLKQLCEEHGLDTGVEMYEEERTSREISAREKKELAEFVKGYLDRRNEWSA